MTVDLAPLICLGLTALGIVAAVLVGRRRGLGAGLRLAGWALIPTVLWLTGLVRLLDAVVDVAADFAIGLVFSPAVWLGIGLFALAMVLLVVGGRLRSRAGSSGRTASRPAQATGKAQAPAVGQRGASVDDDMAEIEELLRRRGIT